MTTCELRALSAIGKARLQAALQDVQFVNPSDLDPYRCNNCEKLAVYHYFATCQHVLCGKCHGQVYKKKCPVGDCTNKSVDVIAQRMDFEFGVCNLQAYCKFRQNGCEESVALTNLLEHQKNCKFSTKNLLPRTWVPPPGYEYTKQLEEELAKFKCEMNEFAKKHLNEKLETFKDHTSQNIEIQLCQFKTAISADNCEHLTRITATKIEKLKNETLEAIQNLEAIHRNLVTSIMHEFEEKSKELEKQLTKICQDEVNSQNPKLETTDQTLDDENRLHDDQSREVATSGFSSAFQTYLRIMSYNPLIRLTQVLVEKTLKDNKEAKSNVKKSA